MPEPTENRTAAGSALTELVLEVFRLNGALLALGDGLTRNLGLTSARWQVMGALAAGPLTVAQVARNMGLQRQSVQRLVDLLEAEGVVVFEENPHHRRAKLVRLTPSGQRKYVQVQRKWTRHANAIGGKFKVKQLQEALAVLREIEADVRQAQSGTH